MVIYTFAGMDSLCIVHCVPLKISHAGMPCTLTIFSCHALPFSLLSFSLTPAGLPHSLWQFHFYPHDQHT